MDIQATKIELVKMILNIDNGEFIKKVTDFIQQNEKADFWNEMSLSDQKEIKRGIESLNRGERVEYDDFLKKIS